MKAKTSTVSLYANVGVNTKQKRCMSVTSKQIPFIDI